MTLTGQFRLAERAYARALRFGRATRGYFRPTYHGIENLEGLGGAVIAANHGLFGMELLGLMLGIDEAVHRPVRALGDELLFATAAQRKIMRTMGACVGRPEVAHTLLTRGELIYVCPGGAREALANKEDRYKLFWDGHYGFVRAAVRANVPIVPLAIVGIDEIYRQVVDKGRVRETAAGQLVADWFGEKYVVPLYAGIGPMPFPQQLEYHFGKPIPTGFGANAASDEAIVRTLHAQAKGAVEAMLARALEARDARERALSGTPGRFARALRYLAG